MTAQIRRNQKVEKKERGDKDMMQVGHQKMLKNRGEFAHTPFSSPGVEKCVFEVFNLRHQIRNIANPFC